MQFLSKTQDAKLGCCVLETPGKCLRRLGTAGAGAHARPCKASAAGASVLSSAWVERERRREGN